MAGQHRVKLDRAVSIPAAWALPHGRTGPPRAFEYRNLAGVIIDAVEIAIGRGPTLS
jgi:hypothetical protein